MRLTQVVLAVSVATMSTASWSAPALSPQCPDGAIVNATGNIPNIVWKAVRSETQAKACIQNVAARLGPEGMLHWFELNGFGSPHLAHPRPELATLTSSWIVRGQGLKFHDGIWRDLAHRAAHSMTVEVYWTRNTSVNVNIIYNYE